jgi:hypothetical protein
MFVNKNIKKNTSSRLQKHAFRSENIPKTTTISFASFFLKVLPLTNLLSFQSLENLSSYAS